MKAVFKRASQTKVGGGDASSSEGEDQTDAPVDIDALVSEVQTKTKIGKRHTMVQLLVWSLSEAVYRLARCSLGSDKRNGEPAD